MDFMNLNMFVYARRVVRDDYECKSISHDKDENRELTYPDQLTVFENDIYHRSFMSHTVFCYEQFQIGYFRNFSMLHNYIINTFSSAAVGQDVFLDQEELDTIITMLKSVSSEDDALTDERVKYAIDLFTKAKALLDADTKEEWIIVYQGDRSEY